MKLRFKLAADRDAWKSQLQDWKSFSIDFGESYWNSSANGGRAGDIEDGTRASGGALLTPAQAAKFAEASKKTAKDLDSLHVDDTGSDEDLIGAGGKLVPSKSSGGVTATGAGSATTGGGAVGMFGFNPKQPSSSSAPPTSKSMAKSTISNADMGEVKPAFIEGYLEKKGHGAIHLGSDWQRRYLRIDEKSRSITYSKTNAASEKPQGSIDFVQISDICAYTEKTDGKIKQDNTRLNVIVGDRTFKFKAKDKQECDKWVASLNEWKDYFLLTMSSA